MNKVDPDSLKISIAVQTHPKRIPVVEMWLDHIGYGTSRQPDNVTMELVIDTEGEGCWRTAHRCWLAMSDGVTHHMQMTDDAAPCVDFLQALPRVIAQKPDVPVSLFCRNYGVMAAKEKNERWFKLRSRPWGYGFVLPKDMVKEWLAWLVIEEPKEHDPAWGEHDDWRMWQFLLARKTPHTWCTVPSLVEHGLPGESLMGHANKNRVATWYIGMDQKAEQYGW